MDNQSHAQKVGRSFLSTAKRQPWKINFIPHFLIEVNSLSMLSFKSTLLVKASTPQSSVLSCDRTWTHQNNENSCQDIIFVFFGVTIYCHYDILWCHQWHNAGIMMTVFNVITPDPFYYHGLALIQAWICNCIHYKVWDEITYTIPSDLTNHPNLQIDMDSQTVRWWISNKWVNQDGLYSRNAPYEIYSLCNFDSGNHLVPWLYQMITWCNFDL